MQFWKRFATWILAHPALILAVSTLGTIILGYFALYVSTDHTAGHFLSTSSTEYKEFERLSEVFGQSQSIFYVVFPEDYAPTDPAFVDKIRSFTESVKNETGVEYVLSLANVPYVVREDSILVSRPLLEPGLSSDEIGERLSSQPFLKGFLLSEDLTSSILVIKVDDAFNDTIERVYLMQRLETEVANMAPSARLAGFPYVRSQYAIRITEETPIFTILAFLISLLVLFISYRAKRAVTLPALVIILGLIWTIGILVLFGHRLNVVTAMLPVLIVIIGMANSVHIATKYYILYSQNGHKLASLQTTIETVGFSTFLTCLTTAIGFGVLVFSGSYHLEIFGVFAAVGIMLLYLLSITLIPVFFSLISPPPERTLQITTGGRLTDYFERLGPFTDRFSKRLLWVSAGVMIVGVVGTLQIDPNIFILSDFRQNDPLHKNIDMFEDRFGGVLPLEVYIEADRPQQFRGYANVQRLARLEDQLSALPDVGLTLSAADIAKLATQGFFNGHPRQYRLPTQRELPFIQKETRELMSREGGIDNLPSFMDTTYTTARIMLGIPDLGRRKSLVLFDSVRAEAERIFPPERFKVILTGTAYVSTYSNESLVRNLLVSLSLALVLISAIMAMLFRSVRLTVISLVPNLLPLLVVGSAMGFAGIILKPSTALIFSLAFGIAVDDTIHFLTKYRIFLQAGHSNDEAIRFTLRDTGQAILFTSVVLTAGFLVFTLSSFGGTVYMGALTALTLAIALLTNLYLLPALLYQFPPSEEMMERVSGGQTPHVIEPT